MPPSGAVAEGRSAAGLGAGLAIRFHERGEHAANALGVDKADPGPVGARPSHLVEQLRAGGARLLGRTPDVIGGVGNVVHGFAAILEELFHTGVRIDRHDQLDPALPDRDHRDLDTFTLEALPSRRAQPQPPLVDPNRLVEIADGDPDMVDPAQHGVDSKPPHFPYGLTRYGPFVVGFTTASYVTVRLPLCTRRPLRPAVDGASDPTEGRRLDRESHRWGNLASDGRGRSDLRIRLRRTRVGAATPDHGGNRRRRRPGLQSDRTYGGAHPAPGARRRHDLRPCDAGASPDCRRCAATGPATHGTDGGPRSVIGAGFRVGRWQRLQLWLLHLVGRP